MASIEEQLAHTRKELERVREEYKEFAYLVSHDFSAPLRQAEGFTRLIDKKYGNHFDEKSARHMEMALSAITHGQKILEGLLTYSRLNTRRAPFQPTDLNACYQNACDSLEDKIGKVGAKITTENLPVINGDANQLQLAFMHLIDNAIKFQHKEATPELHIDGKQIGEQWHLSFTDNGIGIKPAHYKKALKVLQRSVTSDQGYEGIGMGLALVCKVAEYHHGFVQISPNASAGTIVMLTLASKLE